MQAAAKLQLMNDTPRSAQLIPTVQTCDRYDPLYTDRELASAVVRQLTNQMFLHTLSKHTGTEDQT